MRFDWYRLWQRFKPEHVTTGIASRLRVYGRKPGVLVAILEDGDLGGFFNCGVGST